MTSTIPDVRPPARRRVDRADWLVVLVLGAVALAMRRAGLAPSSLWFDDAWVALGASKASWDQVLSVGSVSPGFTLLLKPFLALGGTSPLAAQLLPLAAGVVGPGLLYVALVDRHVRRPAALVSGVLLLSAPVHVTYSVFVKQYSVDVLLSLALLWSAWVIVDDGASRRRWARLLLIACVGFAISASVWPVIAVAVAVAGWCAWGRAEDRGWLAGTAACAAAFGLAWAVLVVAPQVNDLLHDYWASKYIATDGDAGEIAASTVDRLQAAVGGLSRVDPRTGLLGVAIAAVVVGWRRPALGLLLLGPVAIAIGLAAAELAPLGTGRTDMYLYTPVLMLVGLALDTAAGMAPRRAGDAVLVVAVLAACVGAVGVDQGPYPQEDVRTLVGILGSDRRSGDLTLVYPAASFAFGLYTDAPVDLVTSSEYAHGWAAFVRHPDVQVLPNRHATPADYEPIVAAAVEGRDRVWFLTTHEKPDGDEIRRMLASEGLTRQSADVRPGAALELWVRGEPAPPSATSGALVPGGA